MLALVADPDLNDLAMFVRVVERGSFAGAARELGVPTSTASRAVARLEADAKVRVLQRTTRAVKPTAEGRDLFESVAPAVQSLRAAARGLEATTQNASGRLRVSVPTDLASSFLAPVLAAFAERYPLVDLDLSLTNAHVNVVGEGFDVALRATTKLESSSLVARKLGEIEHRLYASPTYLAKHGAPATPKELASHALVLFRSKDLRRTWQLSGSAPIDVRGRIGGDDFVFVRAMILAGAGIGLLPFVNAAADEEAGRLVRVLPALHAKGATLYLLYPSAKNVPARVTAFREHVAEAFLARVGPALRGRSSRS
jgi:DNA-binding transcriptional LysR family regulator